MVDSEDRNLQQNEQANETGDPSLSGEALRKISPKLRMIRNGGLVVNQLRAERSPVVSVRDTQPTVERKRGIYSLSDSPKRLDHIVAENWEKPEQSRDEVFVNVFLHLDQTYPEIPEDLNIYDTSRTMGDEVTRFPGMLDNNLITTEVPLAALEDLAMQPEVSSVEISQPVVFFPPIEQAIASEALTDATFQRMLPFENDGGENILIGIVDVGGYDFAHPDFLDANDEPRFLEIWDQGLNTRDPPETFGYGARISRDNMMDALKAADEYGLPATELEPQTLRMRSSHATHVASIAAGNHGLCHKAEIIGVSLAFTEEEGDRRRSFVDSTRLAHAVKYLLQVAQREEKAISINISLGTNGHAHDGSSSINRWLDHALSKPGRFICVAAGNAGQESPSGPGDLGFLSGRIHTSGRLPASGLKRDLEWLVIGDGTGDLSENELEIWYSMQDRFAVMVRPPGAREWIGPVEPRDYIENQVLSNGTVLSIYNELYDPTNGDNHISCYLSPFFSKDAVIGVTSGVWTIRLLGREVRDGNYHGWIERDDLRRYSRAGIEIGWALPSIFSIATTVDNATISSLATGTNVIAVANYDPERETIHKSSSQGPTRDGKQKPEIAAPGTQIIGANGFDLPGREWIRMTGTSMASPYVTGVAGLMLSTEKRLTAAQIAGIIQRSAEPLPDRDYTWQDNAGFGVINPAQCLSEAQMIFKKQDLTKRYGQ